MSLRCFATARLSARPSAFLPLLGVSVLRDPLPASPGRLLPGRQLAWGGVLAACLLAGTFSATPVWAKENAASAGSSPAASQARMQRDMQYLAADRLRGRGPETAGLALAGDYIADAFQAAGLQTELVDGQPFQPFEIDLGGAAGPAERNRVAIRIEGQPPVVAELEKTMRPLSIGHSGQATGPLVFAGYSVTAPQLNYDDYAGVDAEGAVVLLLRKLPGSRSEAPRFDDAEHRQHAYFATKIRRAVEQGARAVLIVNDRDSAAAEAAQVRRQIAAEQERIADLQTSLAEAPEGLEKIRARWRQAIATADQQLAALHEELAVAEGGLLGIDQAAGADGEKAAVPVVSLSRQIADQLLQAATGRGLLATEAWYDEETTPHSFRAETITVTVETALQQATAETANVVGSLPGSGPLGDQTVVIGAHYDHVGMGGYGSLAPGTVAVHNGADDNASGTVVLMELARRLQRRFVASEPPSEGRRRVVFIAFSGEERGLLGSKHYVASPLFPLAETVAMINLDMVGRLRDNELTVYGTGTAAEFDGLLDRLNAEPSFRLLRVRSGYGPSDHQSFYEQQIPVLFFFTGLHNDYHRPSDDFDKIDFGGMTRITDTILQAAVQLATDPQRPTYQATEPGITIRRQLTAFLGIRMAVREPHVVIEAVVPGSPAERGGLAAGDQIIQLGDRRIAQIQDVRDGVRARDPGDQVDFQVRRQEQLQTFSVTLGERP